MNREQIDSTASQIFGPGDSEEKSRWIKYWQEGRDRYRYYLEQLQRIMLTDFSNARILDLGCGSGGLDTLLEQKCRLLVGLDYKMHILKLAGNSGQAGFVQGNGIRLPFPDSTFDFIFAFDVLEHLTGGTPWQKSFLEEIRRVTAPLGTIMISTPNFWYPYDAHSRTRFSQFLPISIADRIIARKNPEFIQEHQSFRNIRLLRPGRLKRMIKKAGLAPLHNLPCCLDRSEYLKIHPARGILAYLGLGWLFHVEFWLILTKKPDRKQMRIKLTKNQHFKNELESTKEPLRFNPVIDFSRGNFYHQLGKGWHWPEKENSSLRWIERRAHCYLGCSSKVKNLKIDGYSPITARLYIYCDRILVGISQLNEGQGFSFTCPLVFQKDAKHIFSIEIKSTEKVIKDARKDPRELSIQVFSIGVTE